MQEIEQIFGARIASRLSEMKIIKINMPDYRKKRGAKRDNGGDYGHYRNKT